MASNTNITEDRGGNRLKVRAPSGRISRPVAQGSTAQSNYAAGMVHFGSSGSTDVYPFDAPRESGVMLNLACVAASSANVSIVELSTGDVTVGATDNTNIKFKAGETGVTLVSRGTTHWDIVSAPSTEYELTST